MLLEGIGEDPDREGLVETPDRIARMCEEVYGGLYEDAAAHLAKQFTVDNNEMVIEKDITFYSMCEHHLLPFYGKAHIAYIPNGKVVGLSKLARTVDVYARRAQIQEKMTSQIADALEESLDPKGVMVMIEAEHTCMTMRGIRKPGSKTVTTVTRGDFKNDFELQKMFHADGEKLMVDMSRVNRIWNHPLYQTHLHQLLEAEEEREFCRHTVEHFLDVARLTYIFVLEAGLSVSREVIYAAALLHDIDADAV